MSKAGYGGGPVYGEQLSHAVGNALSGCLLQPQIVVLPTASAQVVLGSAEGIAGQTVAIPVSIQGVSGAAAAAQTDILYDDATFDLVDCFVNVSTGEHSVNYEHIEIVSGIARMRVAVHPDDLSSAVTTFADGVFATCHFKIATGATPATYSLIADAEAACDIDGLDFNSSHLNGSIHVCAGCGCN